MIISLDAEKAFDKIQHPFMLKVLDMAGIQEIYLNIIKAIHSKQQTKRRETPSDSTEIRNKTRLSILSIVLEVLARPIRKQKEIKRIQIRKEVKLSLFLDDMIVYISNPKLLPKYFNNS